MGRLQRACCVQIAAQAACREGWEVRLKGQVSAPTCPSDGQAWPGKAGLISPRSTPACSRAHSSCSSSSRPPACPASAPHLAPNPLPSCPMIHLPPSVTPDTQILIFCFPCKNVLWPLDSWLKKNSTWPGQSSVGTEPNPGFPLIIIWLSLQGRWGWVSGCSFLHCEQHWFPFKAVSWGHGSAPDLWGRKGLVLSGEAEQMPFLAYCWPGRERQAIRHM